MSHKKNQAGFTLLEILIVIGITAVLATITVIVLNPPELLRQSRDASRFAGLAALERTIQVFEDKYSHVSEFGDSFIIYVSVPDPALTVPDATSSCSGVLPPRTDGWMYQCVGPSDFRRTDGHGWIPINFRAVPGLSLSRLPIDPLNTANPANPAQNFFYTYATDGSGKFELNAKTESKKFGMDVEN